MELLINIKKEFGHIKYIDKTHTYVDTNTGDVLTSVTTFIKKFENPFKGKYFSVLKALKLSGLKAFKSKDENKIYIQRYKSDFTLDEIKTLPINWKVLPVDLRALWKYDSKVGVTRGSIIHNYAENLWQNKIFPDNVNLDFISTSEDKHNFDISVKILKTQVDNFVSDYSQYYIPVVLELIVGNELIAGQSDLLLYNLATGKLKFGDYKTDKDIKFENKYQTYLKPIEHLQQCNYNKYSLQLSIYRYIFTKALGLSDDIFEENIIIWLNKDNPNYIIHEVPYLKEEVEKILNIT